ncbi:MAG: transketolase C-terminal domain-containing protein [Candidatus Diapherotrites archaeon]|nr:transketolase C-terminal domain-containing protein [Candidatus Diapherotrites archaeon]
MSVAQAVKLAKVNVFPMYPITPATHIAEEISKMVANGEINTEVITVESEHSALSAAMGSIASGARTFTTTSSQGLALMFEILPIISGNRLPMVMAVANRALSAPINIWNDHSDAVSCRDQGWIQLWVESSQEALDATIQAFKISEDLSVQLPVMVNLDGFTLSHVFEPVDVPEQKKVDSFLPEFAPVNILDPKNPKTFGPIAFPNVYMEFRKDLDDAMLASEAVIEKANKDFAKIFNRSYGDGLLDLYKMEDAEFAIIGMGSLCGTARSVIDKLRKEKKKVGLIRLRTLRPFPKARLLKACKNLKALAVIDRHVSYGFEGPLLTDVRSAFFEEKKRPFINGFIAGLGGRDITEQHLQKALELAMQEKQGEWLF